MEEQVQRARMLIQTKRYAEAREILKTIDHPKAREWLQRIDQIMSEEIPASKPSFKTTTTEMAAVPDSIKMVLLRVGELVKQHEYEQALRLLAPLDHPKAQEWRERIQNLATPIVIKPTQLKKSKPLPPPYTMPTKSKNGANANSFAEFEKKLLIVIGVGSLPALLSCYPAILAAHRTATSVGGLWFDLLLVSLALLLLIAVYAVPRLRGGITLSLLFTVPVCLYVLGNSFNSNLSYFSNEVVSFNHPHAWVSVPIAKVKGCEDETTTLRCIAVLKRQVQDDRNEIHIYRATSRYATDARSMSDADWYVTDKYYITELEAEWETTIDGYSAIGRRYKRLDPETTSYQKELYILEYVVVPYPNTVFYILFLSTDRESRDMMEPDVNTVKNSLNIH